MAHYYLMSSLPMLRADGEMPLSYEEFLDMCRSSLKEGEIKALETLSVDSSEGPLMAKWSKFYSAVRDEMNYRRCKRLGRPCTPPDRGDGDAEAIVSAVMNETNPLEAEKMLLELEFRKLDDLVSMHYMDDYALTGYALKLRLLERRTVFDGAKGKAEFGRILGELQQKVLDT